MQKEIPGWKILHCYAVPPGCVINKDNFDQYPLIECGTWISDDRDWMIQSMPSKGEKLYQLVPNTQLAMRIFFERHPYVEGSLEHVLKIAEKLQKPF